MVEENIAQHFRPEERPFLEQVDRWLTQVEEQYQPKLTAFLNPREQYLVENLAHQRGVSVQAYSQFLHSEQKRVLLYPEYFVPEDEDFETQLIEIHYAQKFVELHHREVLGTLLGQGIKREQIGDIHLNDKQIQVEVSQNLTSYLCMNVTKMSNQSVRLEPIAKEKRIDAEERSKTENATITSFRLDNIVATVYNISRQLSKKLIQAEKVKVNFMTVDKADFSVAEEDLISVRGYGRCQIKEIGEERTKKGRHRITYSVLRK